MIWLEFDEDLKITENVRAPWSNYWPDVACFVDVVADVATRVLILLPYNDLG